MPAMDDTIGFGPENMPEVRRAVFDSLVANAFAACDPAQDRAGFVEALWREFAEVLGWQPGKWAPYVDEALSQWADDAG